MRWNRTTLSPWTRRCIASAAAVALGSIALWSAVAGLRAANDDVKWVRSPDVALGLPGAIAKAWSQEASFRPLEILVAHLCDPVSLECTPAIIVQALGLITVAVVVVALARSCLPGQPAAAPLMLLFLALSPATTCAVWQMDSCSQTWTAALGALAALVCWRAVGRCLDGTLDLSAMGTLLAVFIVGCSLKETFYGWSAGIGMALLVTIPFAVRRGPGAATRVGLLLLPTVVVPVLHLMARVRFGALAERMTGEDGSRYQAEIGLNLVVNAAMSAAGLLGSGPFHLATDQSAPMLLRALPYAAVAASVFIVLGAVALAAVGRRLPEAVDLPALAFIAGSCCLSVSATIPMGSVSELYGFGANIGSALIVVGAACALLANQVADERIIARTTSFVCSTVFVLVGAYGLMSRALHFRAVWLATDSVNRAIIEFQDQLEPDLGAGVVRFGSGCLLTRTYGQYVMPPAQAINIEATGPWLARRRPECPIRFAIGGGTFGAMGDRELQIDCKDTIDHGHW